MRRISLLFLLLLGSCATEPSVQSRLAAYTGASTQTLVQHFGVPDKQITVNGVQYLAYSEHHTQIASGGFYSFGPLFGGPFYGPAYDFGYGGAFYGGLQPEVNEYSCETTFLLRDDKVFSYALRGNDCT